MSFDDERAAIEGRFNTQWGSTTEIAWDNVPFTPPATAWVRLSILPGESFNAALGATAVRHPGVIVVQIFTPEDTGTAQARTLAQSAANVFNNARFSGIRCRAAGIFRVGTFDGWYQMNVNIPFERDEFT